MNYICGDDREQVKIEIMDEYVQEDSEIRVIDKIVVKSIKVRKIHIA